LNESVDVWVVEPGALDDERWTACLGLLAAPDHPRMERLAPEADRRAFVVGRAVARAALAWRAGVPPRAWAFEFGSHGRPELAPGSLAPPLRFNVAHTRGLVACAVAADRDVGIDVESLARRASFSALSRRYFSPREVAEIERLPEPLRAARFLASWTLKEAYLKARGLGLGVDLRALGFAIDPPRPDFAPAVGDDPAAWHFEQWRPTPDHVLAVAVRRLQGDRPVVVRHAGWPPGL